MSPSKALAGGELRTGRILRPDALPRRAEKQFDLAAPACQIVAMDQTRLTLYGLPHSLYTARVRAYLRKQGIAYVEVPPTDDRFADVIVPAIGRGIIPVIEMPGGRIIQDSVDIIDHFETAGAPKWSVYPADPSVRALAHLFELYAVVGLTRHAMHYRWSYLERHEAFLTQAFAIGGDEARAQATMGRMQSYLPMLGVNADTIPAIERSFHQLLEGLEAHFARHPYLLGNLPCVGDYALFGPLYGHLGRDPVPLAIMQARAPRVFRWTERMHAPDLDLVEFGDRTGGFAGAGELLDTLGPLLDQIGEEILPDLRDRLAFLRSYVADGKAEPGMPVTAKPHQRIIGEVETQFRGIPYRGGVQPYVFFLWQRLIDAAAVAPEAEAIFTKHGLAGLIECKLPIRVERRDHVEVWG